MSKIEGTVFAKRADDSLNISVGFEDETGFEAAMKIVNKTIFGIVTAERDKSTGEVKEALVEAPNMTATEVLAREKEMFGGKGPAKVEDTEIPDFLNKKKNKKADKAEAAPAKTNVMADVKPKTEPTGEVTITDSDLYKAASSATEAVKSSQAVLDVINKYAKFLKDIQQQDRKQFLIDIEALKAFGPAPQ